MPARILENRDRSPLSREQIARYIPSALAEAPHESRSQRYMYVPTVNLMDAMEAEGFVPVWASQSRTRDEARRAFTKHMIRFAHLGAAPMRVVGDVRAEVILTNSHDGSSSVQLGAGLYRLACLNGLMVGSSVEQYRMQHSPKWRDEIIEGTYRVLDNLGGPVAEQVAEMQERTLSRPEQHFLAEHAASLRWHTDAPAPIEADRLLTIRRGADREPTAWNTLNVLQENAIAGGLNYTTPGLHSRRPTYRSTRPVQGIDDLARINRGIWDSVATLTTGDRLSLASEMVSRLSEDERSQLASRLN